MENETIVKEKLSRPNPLYFISLGFFILGFFACGNPLRKGSIVFNEQTIEGNFMFWTIAIYCMLAFICYFIGIFKIRNYNKNDNYVIKDYKYEFNHYHGMWNMIMIVPLAFGMLFMIMTNNMDYADLETTLFFLSGALFFLVSFILRSTKFKSSDTMGLRCFDFNSFIFFFYAFLMLLLSLLKNNVSFLIDNKGYDTVIFIVLVGLNFILNHFMVYYPAKAMVYSVYHETYNPVITIYKFIRMLLVKHVFFFISLLFSSVLGYIYLVQGINDRVNINMTFILIASFYFGMVSIRFITFLWDLFIRRSSSTKEEKIRSQYKIMLVNSLLTFLLTGLLGAVLYFVYNDKVQQSQQSWFVFIQGGFVSFRCFILVSDLIKTFKSGNPIDIVTTEHGILTTLVMVYSLLLTLFLFFGFTDSVNIFSVVILIHLLVASLALNVDMLIRSILGLRGKIKYKVAEE